MNSVVLEKIDSWILPYIYQLCQIKKTRTRNGQGASLKF